MHFFILQKKKLIYAPVLKDKNRPFVKQLRLDANIDFGNVVVFLLALSCFAIIFPLLERIFRGNKLDIKYIVRKRLCVFCLGNPLHLKDGEIEPTIIVSKTPRGFKISVDCVSASFDDVSSLKMVISGCLRNRYGNYAVVFKEEDIAGRYVDYYIEDVVLNYYKQSVYSSLADVPSHDQTIRMRKKSDEGVLDASAIESIMSEEKPNQVEKFHIPYDQIREFLPQEVSYKETCYFIRQALEFYCDYHKNN